MSFQNAYLTDEDHNAKALQQIGEIIETVKANKEQPKVAKSIYLQKHQKQGSTTHSYLLGSVLLAACGCVLLENLI